MPVKLNFHEFVHGYKMKIKHLLQILVLLVIVSAMTVSAQGLAKGTISGQLIMRDGTVLANKPVFFFNRDTGPVPAPDLYWRVPSVAASTDEEGKFKLPLEEGSYYMGSIMERNDRISGPPRGNAFVFLVQDTEGRPETVQIRRGESVDLGIIELRNPPAGERVNSGRISAVEGVVTDVEGRPLEGAVVYAYASESMTGENLFVSDSTGDDGKYFLRVPGDGDYYLQVRDSISGKTYLVKDSVMQGKIKVNVNKFETVRGLNLQTEGFRTGRK